MGFCLKDYFQTAGGLSFNSTNNLFSNTNKGGGLFESRASIGKPFLPYCAVVTDASGVLKPDTIAHQQTNIQTYIDLYTQLLQASYNAVDGLSGGTNAEYLGVYGASNIDFSRYLAYKIGDPRSNGNANYNAYFNAAFLVWNFWTSADPAWTAAQLNAALRQLAKDLTELCYPRLYVPPGRYLFNTGNAFQVDWHTWVVAGGGTPVVGFQCVELDSIE